MNASWTSVAKQKNHHRWHQQQDKWKTNMWLHLRLSITNTIRCLTTTILFITNYGCYLFILKKIRPPPPLQRIFCPPKMSKCKIQTDQITTNLKYQTVLRDVQSARHLHLCCAHKADAYWTLMMTWLIFFFVAPAWLDSRRQTLVLSRTKPLLYFQTIRSTTTSRVDKTLLV
jgi:hypothetical protein